MKDNLFYIRSGAISSEIGNEDWSKSAQEFWKQWESGQSEFTINTSGSTGTPKPIEITRVQMEASAKMTARAFGLLTDDNALACLNVDYIAGKMMLVRGMVNDLNLYITEPSSNPLVGLPKNLRIDFMAVVPLQMETMIDNGHADQLNKLKAIIVGGAPISFALAEKIKLLTCPVYATYGMTETVSHIALKRLNGNEVSPYFKTLEGVQVAQDQRGCLTINSVLTNHQTITTNDVVNIVDEQTFEWLGRADNVINSGGLKIHPEQLEDQIRKILVIKNLDCNLIVVGIADKVLGEKVVLILETESLGSDTIAPLINDLKVGLPNHHAPKEICFLNKFVYTETGKVKRKETVNLIS